MVVARTELIQLKENIYIFKIIGVENSMNVFIIKVKMNNSMNGKKKN